MATDNEMTQRLLDLLLEKYNEEPPAPDLDVHIGSHLELVAGTYAQWQRSIDGLRMLCGVRLVDEALAARKSLSAFSLDVEAHQHPAPQPAQPAPQPAPDGRYLARKEELERRNHD